MVVLGVNTSLPPHCRVKLVRNGPDSAQLTAPHARLIPARAGPSSLKDLILLTVASILNLPASDFTGLARSPGRGHQTASPAAVRHRRGPRRSSPIIGASHLESQHVRPSVNTPPDAATRRCFTSSNPCRPTQTQRCAAFATRRPREAPVSGCWTRPAALALLVGAVTAPRSALRCSSPATPAFPCSSFSPGALCPHARPGPS